MIETKVRFKRSKQFKDGIYNYGVYVKQDKSHETFCGSIAKLEKSGPIFGNIEVVTRPEKFFYTKTFNEMKKQVKEYIEENLYGIQTVTY